MGILDSIFGGNLKVILLMAVIWIVLLVFINRGLEQVSEINTAEPRKEEPNVLH